MIRDSWTLPAAEKVTDLVSISGLVVRFGSLRVLDEVNLRIPAGEIFGLLGPNGAGKTTLFRVLSTALAASAGEVRICGSRLQDSPRKIRASIAYMPDMAPMPSDLRAAEYLRYFAGAYGLRGGDAKSRVMECLEAVGLSRRSGDVCTQLSLGMRQRLALAKAILHRPKLMILDEPASGLDPEARADLKDILRQQAQNGATVILSSHVISEIQGLCSSIGLLQQGRLLDAGPIHQVLDRFGTDRSRFLIQAPGQGYPLASWLAQIPGIKADHRASDSDSIELLLDELILSPSDLFSKVGAAGLGVIGMHRIEPSLEEIVLGLGSKNHGS